MTAQFARTPYRGRSAGGTMIEPHAALLIDFDNVTMGIRSDLTKELKNLLNSDIIKGKVAVQRAYADWRRYPQYIVPLAESSVDLIFAPAYGSAKKNATDIRLAIDAVELVFTRPEIGTIILLSGDSDFSSLVLKLKEYGKYVIGVGIRESASDLLVQNCDEYYSYSALTGLTRAGEETPVISEDPWELVEMAFRQMSENNDVMRSDRLKQVLLELDPSFDEKGLGYQKFNKFLQDAAGRGIISLRKQENGQYEIAPPSSEAVEEAASAARGEPRESRSRRGRRGRGRRDEPRESREEREEREEQAAEEAPEVTAAVTAAAEPEAAVAEPTPPEPAPTEVERPAAKQAAPAAGEAATEAATEAPAGDGLHEGYDLLRRAVGDLVRKGGPIVRDSDVKRRMLELQTGWDEAALGFSKFSRFLRRAHEDQVITLRKTDSGANDVMIGDGGVHVDDGGAARGGGGRGRGRSERSERGERGGRGREPAQEQAAAPAAVAADAAPKGATQATAAAAEQRPQQPSAQPAAPAGAVGFRRGSRGRAAPSGPPPLLEGQAAVVSKPASSAAASAPAEAAKPARAAKPAKAAASAEATSRPAKGGAAKRPAKKGKPAAKAADKAPARAPAKQAAKKGGAARLQPGAFGLPQGEEAVANYLASAYKGVGPKSVAALFERVGADRVFETLEHEPDVVREVLGGARAERLLDAWADDIAFRRANAAPASTAQSASAAPARSAAKRGGAGAGKGGGTKGGAPRRGRRGGRSPRRGSPAGK